MAQELLLVQADRLQQNGQLSCSFHEEATSSATFTKDPLRHDVFSAFSPS